MQRENNTPPANMEAVLAEIDQRPFLTMVTAVAGQVSPSCDVVYIRDVLRKAIRCACLLDIYTETDDPRYHTEFGKQRGLFYSMIPSGFQEKLRKVERETVQYFEKERYLRRRMQYKGEFDWQDIDEYVRGKSSDNIFYGKILELMAEGWTPEHSAALRIQTILFDIGKDIHDYPDDVKNEFPNTLYMALTTRLTPQSIPPELPEAIYIANETGVAASIVSIATDFRKQVLPHVLSSSPTLKEELDKRFEAIRRGLRPF